MVCHPPHPSAGLHPSTFVPPCIGTTITPFQRGLGGCLVLGKDDQQLQVS